MFLQTAPVEQIFNAEYGPLWAKRSRQNNRRRSLQSTAGSDEANGLALLSEPVQIVVR